MGNLFGDSIENLDTLLVTAKYMGNTCTGESNWIIVCIVGFVLTFFWMFHIHEKVHKLLSHTRGWRDYCKPSKLETRLPLVKQSTVVEPEPLTTLEERIKWLLKRYGYRDKSEAYRKVLTNCLKIADNMKAREKVILAVRLRYLQESIIQSDKAIINIPYVKIGKKEYDRYIIATLFAASPKQGFGFGVTLKKGK